MEKFLTIGKGELKEQLFWPIDHPKDENSVKPYGGLWLTEHQSFNYNAWADFLSSHPHILLFSYQNPVKIPSACVTLKTNTHIFNLASYEDFLFLQKHYPHPEFPFDYKRMALDYDGIYFNIFQIICDKNLSRHLQDQFWHFGVNSLVLFHLSCIDFYQSAILHFTQINFDDIRDEVSYEILVDQKIKQPLLTSNYDETLLDIAKNVRGHLAQNGINLQEIHTYQLSVLVAQLMREQLKKEVDAYITTQQTDEKAVIRMLTKKVKED